MKLQLISTCYDGNNEKNQVKTEVKMTSDPKAEHRLLCLFPQVKYQEITGFGGAFTDSTGYIYSLLSQEQKKEFLQRCFGEGKMNIVRIPLDSCDFSLEHFEADSNPNDTSFQEFSLERADQYIRPLLEDAETFLGKKLDIMLSPWSPPAFMKTNGERNHGGKLKPEFFQHWANYICHYILAYRARGYQVSKLTMQNEPMAKQTWDSCEYSKEEQRDFIKDYLWSALVSHGLEDVGLYIWDHNKESAFEWAETIVTPETEHMIEGLAFHWYSGDHFQQLAMIREKFPKLKLLLSEACIEFGKFDKSNFLVNAQKYAHDMIGNFNAGMNTFIDWNLLLDEEGGPNHVKNFCDAPFLFDTKEKELLQRNIYEYVWHFSHFLEENAVRIGCSIYSEHLEVVAFAKGKKIVFVALNRTDEDISVIVKINGFCGEILLPEMSIATGEIE